MTSITPKVFKNTLGFPQVYNFNKNSCVETGKKYRILYLVCKKNVGNPKDRVSRDKALTTADSAVLKELYVHSIYEPCHEKTNVLVSNLVLHKPGCTATEDC